MYLPFKLSDSILSFCSAYHLSTTKSAYMCTVPIDLIVWHFVVAATGEWLLA